MFKLFDRTLFFNFVKAYLVVLASTLSLFIVVDLFTNLDAFAEQHRGLDKLLPFVATYYAAKVAVIFDRLSEAIVLLAAMFTVAWMQRNNEILPLLSAGVSTRRIVRPILVASLVMVGAAAANQELVMPRIDPYLVELRADNDSEKEMDVKGGYESNGVHVSGRVALMKERLIRDFTVVFPNQFGFDGMPTIQAKEARYFAAGEYRPQAGWLLTSAHPPTLPGAPRRDVIEAIADLPGKYFLTTHEIDFAAATRPKNWAMFLPTVQLLREMGKLDHNRLSAMAVQFHMRLTRPILGILLVTIGLAIILRDQNRHMFISAGLCLIVCMAFFVVGFACKHLGDHEHLAPAVAAWLPVLGFGPLSFAMFDAVHT